MHGVRKETIVGVSKAERCVDLNFAPSLDPTLAPPFGHRSSIRWHQRPSTLHAQEPIGSVVICTARWILCGSTDHRDLAWPITVSGAHPYDRKMLCSVYMPQAIEGIYDHRTLDLKAVTSQQP